MATVIDLAAHRRPKLETKTIKRSECEAEIRSRVRAVFTPALQFLPTRPKARKAQS